MRRIAALLIALAGVLPVAASASGGRAVAEPDTDDVLSGRCEGCLVIAVDVRADAIETTMTLGAPVTVADEVRSTLNYLDLSERNSALVRFELTDLRYVAGDHEFRMSAADRDRHNAACAREQADPQECAAARDAIVPEFVGAGRVVVQFRARETGSWPGGHRMWARPFKNLRESPLTIVFDFRSDRSLTIDGDLVSVGERHWRHRDRGRGFVAVSTSPDWATLLDAYRAMQRERMVEPGADAALAAIPSAPSGASPADAVQQHWLWIRRNLRAASNLENGGSTPSPIAQTLARGWGDCTDLSLLMAALLARDGIASEPVFADGRPNDDLPQASIPVARIDHVLLYLPALDRYVDPTYAYRRALATGGDRRIAFALRAGIPPFAIDADAAGLVDRGAIPETPLLPPPRKGWPQFPISRDTLLPEIASALRRKCEDPRTELSAESTPETCRAYVERALPICTYEARSALPAQLASREAHDGDLRAFFDCLRLPAIASLAPVR